MRFNAIKLGLVGASVLMAGLVQAQKISVTVDGDPVAFTTTNPRYVNGRVLVPLRGVFEQMGAFVQWHPETRTVTANKANKDVKLQIGSPTAYVDGQAMTLDVPPQIMAGSTMVPLRFLSESLGADVQWINQQNLVAITTTGNARINTSGTLPARRFEVLNAGTVIPVTLDQTLSSNGSRRGDKFTATVQNETGTGYAGLATGTKVEGRVVTARPQRGKDPGVLELEFLAFKNTDGTRTKIDGSLISLDNEWVSRNADGVLVARSDKKDDRLIYAGVGAGAGLIVGILTKKPLEGTILGGILGYLYGDNKAKQTDARNVVLQPGTEFGVRLDQDARIRI